MCLTNLKTNTPEITEKDITVYKVIETYNFSIYTESINHYYTPFQKCFVKIGKTYKSDMGNI